MLGDMFKKLNQYLYFNFFRHQQYVCWVPIWLFVKAMYTKCVTHPHVYHCLNLTVLGNSHNLIPKSLQPGARLQDQLLRLLFRLNHCEEASPQVPIFTGYQWVHIKDFNLSSHARTLPPLEHTTSQECHINTGNKFHSQIMKIAISVLWFKLSWEKSLYAADLLQVKHNTVDYPTLVTGLRTLLHSSQKHSPSLDINKALVCAYSILV